MNVLKVKCDVYILFMVGNDYEDVIKWYYRVINMILCGL